MIPKKYKTCLECGAELEFDNICDCDCGCCIVCCACEQCAEEEE